MLETHLNIILLLCLSNVNVRQVICKEDEHTKAVSSTQSSDGDGFQWLLHTYGNDDIHELLQAVYAMRVSLCVGVCAEAKADIEQRTPQDIIKYTCMVTAISLGQPEAVRGHFDGGMYDVREHMKTTLTTVHLHR